MILKSRNTMVSSAVLFLIVVILLRLSGGFFEDNIVRVVGSIAGGQAENIPLIDFGSIDLSWLNPTEWSLAEMKENIVQWLHHMIDSIFPAFISTVNIASIMITTSRIKVIGAVTTTVAKTAPVAV